MVVDGTPRRPQGTADLVLSNINIDLAPVGAVRVHATADPDQVKGKLTVDDHGGGQLAVEGDLSLAAGRAYHATARTGGLNLQVVRLVVPTLREIDGQLQASLELTGSAGGGGAAAAAPQLHGTASITHGRLGLAGQPTFHDIEAAIAVHPDKIELTRIAARSGDGRLDGKGWVTLERLHPTSLTLTAQARSFRIAAAGSSSARLDGDFAVEGALRASVLAGTVSIPKATLWLPKLSTSSGNSNLQSLTDHTDVRFVDAAADAARERAARQAAGQGQPPLRLDVHAHAGTIHVRGKDLDIELESDLQVATGTEGAAKGKPLLTGSVRVRRGRISINGQRFDIDEGTATFDGSPEINPALTIRLTRQFPEAQVIVQISGTPKSPRLQMTSDPPIYDQGQIFSLILTGQAGGAPSAGRGPDPTSAITSMVLGRIADQIAPQLGLDVLRVENVDLLSAQGQPLGGTDTRVEVGKYVSDRIYVSYAHVFGANETQNTNEARMEYRITTRWMIETIFGDAGVGSVDAVWTRRY
jgi:translocation and assembly module TamB